MTDYIAQVVKQGPRFRVALIPVSYRGSSPIVAASWAERDSGIFEVDTHPEADAFIGQMSDKTWSVAPIWDDSPGAVVPLVPPTESPRAKAKGKARR